MAVLIILGLLVLVSAVWLVLKDRRAGTGFDGDTVSRGARRARDDADRRGGGAGGDGMNAG